MMMLIIKTIMSEKIFVISGPTASGKSGLALQFADYKDITIINADSLQIYQGLAILSSQPTISEQNQVSHKLYSILETHESSSVALWLKLANQEIKNCWQNNKIPVIVGGTGMYISKLIEGINEIPEIQHSIKSQAKEEFESLGIENFRKKLISLGEEKEKIEKLDKQRLIRIYEVFNQTGKSLSWWQNQSLKTFFSPQIFTHINLNPDRNLLYKNCNLRFEKMMENGAINEVNNLLKQGIKEDSQVTKTLGFLEIKQFLSKEISEKEAIEIASQKTRNYAKRQLTWFRNQLPNKIIFEENQQALNYLKSL